MLKGLEKHWRDVVLGNNQGRLSSLTRGFLQALSWPYQLVTSVRNAAYDRGIFSSHTVEIPIISVGNIVAGGTGKTPLILKLAEHFSDQPVAVLSRGYRSAAERSKAPIFLSRGHGPLYGPEQCGDEPFLISSRLPKVLVIVGRDRIQAAHMAAEAGAKLILLDDGMQHRRLKRDLEIVVVDANDPFGLNYLLPRGFLREGLKGLQRAHMVVLNHVKNDESFALLQHQLRQYTDAQVVGTQVQVTAIQTLHGQPVKNLRGKKVALFCGIAKPEKFRATVEDQGALIIDELATADHHLLPPKALVAFSERSRQRGAEMLLCTEKDKVKLPDSVDTSLPIAWVKVDLTIAYGHDVWQGVRRDFWTKGPK